MPAALTHQAIMLMARERLAEIRDVVKQGIDRRTAAGQPVRNLERQLLAMVEEAHDQMSTAPHSDSSVPGQLFARPLEDRVSKFAVMGSMGPDIAAFSAALQPGQQWLFDNVHKGTPDSDRELVMAGTCDLALEIWAEAKNRLAAADARQKMRAYVLGHLCHVAGDVVSHPFINDIEWHFGTDVRDKLDHADGEGSNDAMVAKNVFLRSGTRGGEAWGKWWPELREVPDEFFQAYEQAMENIYTARTKRRRGFGDFEKKLQALDPPGLDASFIKDGYSLYRSGVIDVAYGFGAGSWFGMLGFLFVPAIFLPLLIHALPTGRQLFVPPDNPADADKERQWFEVLSLPLYAGTVDALIYGGWVASLTSKGVKGRTVAGLVASGLMGLGFVGYVIELAARGMPKEARWPLFFMLPLAVALAFMTLGIADATSDGKKRRSAVSLIHALPIIQFVIFIIALFFVFMFGTMELPLDDAAFWVLQVFWALFCTILWVVFSFKARDAKIPEQPDTFTAQRRHAVRLFDDASLFRDPVAAAAGQPDRFFPSGRRPLVRLWWEGSGTMSVRSDRYGLVFKLESGGTTTQQELPAPVAPMKPTEYLAFLTKNVKDRDNSVDKLKGSMMFPDQEEDYELPPGATFAAFGDDQTKEDERRAQAAEFKKLGANADSDFVLYHAPKPMRAIRFTPTGPIENPFDLNEGDLVTRETENGYLYPHNQLDGRSSETVMSYAADVAAFLCMGGATQMDPTRPLTPVYQVFRNWDLDRRRINEWKMLVAGGALSEKPDGPATYDGAMLHGSRFAPANPAAWKSPISDAAHGGSAAAAEEGEETMRKEGWVRLLRRWLELERQPDQNLIDPNARLFPDWPTNQQLSRALAFLLDLPEPA